MVDSLLDFEKVYGGVADEENLFAEVRQGHRQDMILSLDDHEKWFKTRCREYQAVVNEQQGREKD